MGGGIPGCQPPNDSCAGNRRPADGDHVLELRLKDAVEVLARADGHEGEGVCECRKDSNPVFFVLAYRNVVACAAVRHGSRGNRRRRASKRWGNGQRQQQHESSARGETYSLEFSNCALTAMIVICALCCVELQVLLLVGGGGRTSSMSWCRWCRGGGGGVE